MSTFIPLARQPKYLGVYSVYSNGTNQVALWVLEAYQVQFIKTLVFELGKCTQITFNPTELVVNKHSEELQMALQGLGWFGENGWYKPMFEGTFWLDNGVKGPFEKAITFASSFGPGSEIKLSQFAPAS
jgi:hypothetical protein